MNTRGKNGVQRDIWKHYNPKLYFQEFVNFEDRKNHIGVNDEYSKPKSYNFTKCKNPFRIIKEEFLNLLKP
jgi:hypothetical protein